MVMNETHSVAAADQTVQSNRPLEQDDDEISLLDLLQVVVENLRLLVLGPIVVGLLALGYAIGSLTYEQQRGAKRTLRLSATMQSVNAAWSF
jgi:hypothetical protein